MARSDLRKAQSSPGDGGGPTEVGLVLAAFDLDPAGPRLDQEVSDQLLLGVQHCATQEVGVTSGNMATTLRFETANVQ